MKHLIYLFLSLVLLLAACAPRVTESGEAEAAATESTTSDEAATDEAATDETQEPLTLTLLGINDLHGNLLPSRFRLPNVEEPIEAGGVETLATILNEKKAENPNTLFIGAGDLIGASPLISSLLEDEVTIDAMNKLGLAVSVVGNHEFDKGKDELLRMQNGGCETPEESNACLYGIFTGAEFPYIAANIVDTASGETLLPPYVIQNVDGVDIAFIGAVLKDTPTIVVPAGVAGLEFTDEAEAINSFIPELKEQGVETIVALVHQGGNSPDYFDTIDCTTLEGPIVDITRALDPAIDVVMSGHTHRGYQCRVDGRLVTQGDAFGHLVTQVNLTIDRTTKDVTEATSENIVVDPTKYAPDAAMTALVAKAKELTDPIASEPIATMGAEQILREGDASGQSPLGLLIADAQLAATSTADMGGAQIAFMNPGGVRADLPATANPEGLVTYGDAFAVQPFGNVMVTMTLTGDQLKTLLEQQWLDQDRPRILLPSQGFTYTYDEAREPGDKVLAETMALNGEPIDPAASYRVAVNNFLADGGDKFVVLTEGTERVGGDLDLTAFQNYLQDLEAAGTPATAPALDRITRLN
ncbi:MAG: bifunctional metallophosphatase/5'-nucleotidase [Trueperaceae bacterium]